MPFVLVLIPPTPLVVKLSARIPALGDVVISLLNDSLINRLFFKGVTKSATNAYGKDN